MFLKAIQVVLPILLASGNLFAGSAAFDVRPQFQPPPAESPSQYFVVCGCYDKKDGIDLNRIAATHPVESNSPNLHILRNEEFPLKWMAPHQRPTEEYAFREIAQRRADEINFAADLFKDGGKPFIPQEEATEYSGARARYLINDVTHRVRMGELSFETDRTIVVARNASRQTVLARLEIPFSYDAENGIRQSFPLRTGILDKCKVQEFKRERPVGFSLDQPYTLWELREQQRRLLMREQDRLRRQPGRNGIRNGIHGRRPGLG